MTEKLQFEQHQILICRRRNRRNMSIKIVPFQPIQVLTNAGMDERLILKFLADRKDWIQKVLKRFENEFRPSISLVLKRGKEYPLRGIFKSIQPVITLNKKVFFSETDKEILLHIPQNHWSMASLETEFPEHEKAFIQFYKNLAIRELSARVSFWETKMALKAMSVSFRLTSSKWGSCNHRGNISLNWKLICMAPELQDYVIVHELCHLVHLNHSQRFWNMVESEIPDRKFLQKKLNGQQFIPDFLKAKIS